MKKIDKKILRRYGYNKEREGIISNYMNSEGKWNRHLQNSKNIILKSAENKKKGICVIAGSGWWLDIPVDELSSVFEKIILMDISHPTQIIHKKKKYPNLELIETDITNVVEKIYFYAKKYKKEKNKLKLEEFITHDYNFIYSNKIKADFVVSLNILSQLGIFICNYLKKTKIFGSDEIKDFERLLQENHIKMLPKGKSCLITDYYKYKYDFSDKIISKEKLLKIDLPKGRFSEEWQWDFKYSGKKKEAVSVVKCVDF